MDETRQLARLPCCKSSASRQPSTQRFPGGRRGGAGRRRRPSIGRQAGARAQTPPAAPHRRASPLHSAVSRGRHDGARTAAGAPPPEWSPALSLEEMDRSGIATAILSIAQPGIWYGDNVEESPQLTRRLNEYGAGMGKDHPGRFGLFACIAPPDVEAASRRSNTLRHAQGRWHRPPHQLPGQVSGRSVVCAGL